MTGLCLTPFLLGLSAGPGIQVTPSLRFSYFTGYTSYTIEGDSSQGPWRSRLTFPVNNQRVDGGAALRLETFSLELSLSGWSTVEREAGTLKDDDYQNGIRDVWSRSNAELEAWGLTGKLRCFGLGPEDFRFGPVASIQYDRFDYDVYNVRQFGLSPDDVAEVDGKVLTYRQERVSCPLGMGFRWKLLPSLVVEGEAAVSFFTYVWDEDDHILRYKRSETEGMAFAVPASLAVDWVILERVHLGAWGEIFYLRTWWGHQDQAFYGGPRAGEAFEDVKTEIERLTFTVGVRLAVDL